MLNEELINNEHSKEWVIDLPNIVALFNKHYKHEPLKIDQNDEVETIDKRHKKYIVEKRISKRKVGNKIEYLIKWQNYPDSENTWESRTELMKTIGDMIKLYEASIKN